MYANTMAFYIRGRSILRCGINSAGLVVHILHIAKNGLAFGSWEVTSKPLEPPA